MPTYDYRCQECNHEFSVIESISAHVAAKPRCSECESSKVERVFTAINVKTSKKRVQTSGKPRSVSEAVKRSQAEKRVDAPDYGGGSRG